MCPNCILNQANPGGGIYVAFGVCLIFFLVALAAIFWAFRNGEFTDMEEAKFDMMDDSDEATVGAQARAALERARLNSKMHSTS